MTMAAQSSKPLVIIGAGPAGLGAAIEASRAGLACTIVDEATHLGGQIYRQPPKSFEVEDPHALGRDYARGEALRAEFAKAADKVEVLSETSVVGIWGDGRDLLCASGDRTTALRTDRLVIAAGAYDRPVPFPGWTLPGVMTAGGAQTLVKTMRVRPGRRALVAGTGPLLLVVASQLHKVGVEVVAVLEAGKPSWSPAQLPKVWGEWGLVRDALDYWWTLRRAGIPLLFNHTVFAAHGEQEVEAASYGPVDPGTWRPHLAEATRVEVDLVVAGFGFVPNTELTECAGCRHDYANELGGWIPLRDVCMQTTVRGVFAVGDGAGVAGSLVALEEGRIAGITAAEQAGAIDAPEAVRRREGPNARLRSLARVRGILDDISRIRPGLNELATPETLVCRCEEVSLVEVRGAVDQGARDLQAVKLLTRLGMGPCQGRNCAPSTATLLCGALGCHPADVGRIHPRPPVKPVTLGALATMAKDETEAHGRHLPVMESP